MTPTYKLVIGLDRNGPVSREIPWADMEKVLDARFKRSDDRDLVVAALSFYCYQMPHILDGQIWVGQLDGIARDGDTISGRTSGTYVHLKVPLTEGPW